MRELRDHLHRSLVRGGVEPLKAAALARGVLAQAKAYLYAAGVLPQQMAAVAEDLDDTVAAAAEARSRETLPPDEPCCDANARGHHCDCRPCGKCESENDQPIPYNLTDAARVPPVPWDSDSEQERLNNFARWLVSNGAISLSDARRAFPGLAPEGEGSPPGSFYMSPEERER